MVPWFLLEYVDKIYCYFECSTDQMLPLVCLKQLHNHPLQGESAKAKGRMLHAKGDLANLEKVCQGGHVHG